MAPGSTFKCPESLSPAIPVDRTQPWGGAGDRGARTGAAAGSGSLARSPLPSLTANLLHDQGAQAVAEAVRENRALTSLQ